MTVEPSTIEPFEISSIRPPTENYSLSFRLTRNCYWNKCAFCPAYKFGSRFSKGEFEEANEEQVVREIRTLVEEINTDTEILSDSASNLLDIYGRLPADREKMLKSIDRYLDLTGRDKLVFSLESRLGSFMGQYGGISSDIASALGPYLKNGRLDFSSMPDEDMKGIISLIKSRLMP